MTLGNAVIALVAENNELFPDRKVTEKKIAISRRIMNMVAPIFGGVPMCHGAGGMAGHVRFGAKTGGSIYALCRSPPAFRIAGTHPVPIHEGPGRACRD
ncbi:MAG: putative sulfate/molybdate transporter [Syntrophales bacterium]|nr:putative sulfate/molybdate transporter [Syntrophales bacterium]